MIWFGLALSLAFWPGAFDPASSLRWCVLAALPLALWWSKPRLTVAHLFGIVFVAWCWLSLAWTAGIYEGINQAVNLLWLACAFVWGSSVRDPEALYRGLGIGLAVSSTLAIGQFLGWQPVDETDRTPAGLFMLGWVLANSATPVAIALLGCGHRLIAAAVMPAALLPGSRGAILGLGAAGILWMWERWNEYGPYRRAAVVVGLLVGLVVAVAGLHVSAHNDSLGQRTAIWSDTAGGLTVAGRGLGAFYATFPATAQHTLTHDTRPSHAHNDWLEIAYDTGLPGVVLLLATILATVRGSVRTEHYILAVIAAEACFIFVLYQPLTAFLAAFALGHLARRQRQLRHMLDGWRMELAAGVSGFGRGY